MAMFERAAEVEDLVATARRFVREHYDYAERHAARAEGEVLRRERWQEMAELGWLAAGVSEAGGGLGLPRSLVSELVEALGPAAMPEPLIAQCARSALLLDQLRDNPAASGVLGDWLEGTALVSLVVNDGTTAADGDTLRAAPTDSGWLLNGTVDDVCDAAAADRLLVPVVEEGGAERLLLIDADAAGVAIDACLTVDGRGAGRVHFSNVPVAADACVASGDLHPARAEGDLYYALLLASETLGILRALLARTRDYLAERQQFGQALIDFQALQHRLVDMHLSIVRLESQLVLARTKVDQLGLVRAARYVAAARIQADEAGHFVGGEAAQLHGGIGMTDELVVGHYVKRLLGNRLRGGTTQHHAQQFRDLTAAGG